MKLPEQTFTPRVSENSYRREFNELIAANAVRRLWAKDVSLWPAGEAGTTDISSNLNWLDLPDEIGMQMARVSALVDCAQAEGFEDLCSSPWGTQTWRQRQF